MRRSKLRGSFLRRSRCSLSMGCSIVWGKKWGRRAVSSQLSASSKGAACQFSAPRSAKIPKRKNRARFHCCRCEWCWRPRHGRAALGLDGRGARPHTGSPAPHLVTPYGSLRPDGNEVGQAERCVCSLSVAHVGVVVVIDVDVGNLLEVALTSGADGGADDVHGAGGTS